MPRELNRVTSNKTLLNFVAPSHKNLKQSISGHIRESVKQILALNQNRELLTWSRIKNDESIQGLISTLASWFGLSLETVAVKFAECLKNQRKRSMDKFQELGINALKPNLRVSKKSRPLGMRDALPKKRDFLLAALPPSIIPTKSSSDYEVTLRAQLDLITIPDGRIGPYAFHHENGLINTEIWRILKRMQELVREGRVPCAAELTGARSQEFEVLDRKLWRCDEKKKALWTKQVDYKEGDPYPPRESLSYWNHHEFGKVLDALGYAGTNYRYLE